MTPPQHKTMKKERFEDRFNLYLQYVRRGKFHNEACRLAKIKPAVVKERLRTDPQFRQDAEDAHAEFAERVERVLVDAAFGEIHYVTDPETGDKVKAQRDTKAALDWLKARNASIFNPARQVDVQVNHTVELPFADFHALKAQLEARRAPELMPGQDYEDIVEAEIVDEG